MCARPWWTMRFSPRFLKVFLRFPAPSFFSGTAPSGAAAASFLAISHLDGFLLRDSALAWAFARPRVGSRPLTVHRQRPAVAHTAVGADFHQPLDVHGDLLAEIALDAPLLLDHPADRPDVVFRQILHADVGADPGLLQDAVRPDAADAENVGEPDLDALGAREIDACDTSHLTLPLFVLLVRTDHAHHAAAAHDLALVA